MKKIVRKTAFLTGLLLLVSCGSFSSSSDAEFQGGIPAMQAFIQNSIQYPQEAIEQDLQGRVFLKFVVEEDGTVSYVAVEKGVNSILDKEAIRVIRSMPKWKPAIRKGKPSRQVMRIPINFTLE